LTAKKILAMVRWIVLITWAACSRPGNSMKFRPSPKLRFWITYIWKDQKLRKSQMGGAGAVRQSHAALTMMLWTMGA
jgi:hypothetical protein